MAKLLKLKPVSYHVAQLFSCLTSVFCFSSWNRHSSLPSTPERTGDLNQPDRLDLRMDPWLVAPRGIGQQRCTEEVRRNPRKSLHRHHRIWFYDQGSCHLRCWVHVSC